MANITNISLEELPKCIFGIRLSAVVETGLLLGILLAADFYYGAGNRFFDIQPHPFWIPVLLIATQYGLENGLVAAVIASVALLLFNIPPPLPGQDILALATTLSFNPALWIVGSLFVGGLSERHLRQIHAERRGRSITASEAAVLRQSIEHLASANERLENRVAGQISTFAGLYEASKAVERETPGEVLMGAARLVRSALNAKEFSIFLLNDGVLEAALCEGWPADSKKTRRFRAGQPLFDEVVARKTTVHVAMSTGNAILAHQGVLAGPITNPQGGAVRGMVKIESLAFEDFTPASVHNFRVLCDWLGAALARAEGLQQARETSSVNEATPLFPHRILSRFLEYLVYLAKQNHFPLASLDVDINARDENIRATLPRLIATAMSQSLQGTNIAFESGDELGSCILLAGITEIDVRAAAARLQFAVQALLSKQDIDADIRVTVRMLNIDKSRASDDDKKDVA